MKKDKDRLYELMYKVAGVEKKLLCEENLPLDKKQLIVNDFISFVSERINISENQPKVDMVFEETDFTQENKSFAQYNPSTYEIKVIGYNRNLADTLRSLAHELIHHKQNINGELNEKSGETGSQHENEANALAGQLMRDYGKQNPNIFE